MESTICADKERGKNDGFLEVILKYVKKADTIFMFFFSFEIYGRVLCSVIAIKH